MIQIHRNFYLGTVNIIALLEFSSNHCLLPPGQCSAWYNLASSHVMQMMEMKTNDAERRPSMKG
jgi:hypothetical protein